MTICEACGAPTQPGESFCGACGTYLEWQEEPPDAATPTAPPAGTGTVPGPQVAAGGDAGAGAKRARAATPSPAVPTGSGADLPPADAGHRAADPSSRAAAAPPAKPAHPERAAQPAQPEERAAPVRPGAPATRPRRRQLADEDRRPLPGETICPDCGAGNVPTRRFCRRCGTDLVDAAVVPQLPWYRRLFRRTPRPARVAGTRPSRRRSMKGLDRRLGILVLLVVVVAGGWVGRARVMDVVDLARDRVSKSGVHATTFAASSQARGHPAEAVGDGAPNSYWSPRATSDAEGEFVTLGLEAPVRLAYVNIFNGPTSEGGKPFFAEARLSTVELEMTRVDGGVEKRTFELEDEPGGQPFHVGVDDVVSVRVTILGTYGLEGDRHVALGEVELFKRS